LADGGREELPYVLLHVLENGGVAGGKHLDVLGLIERDAGFKEVFEEGIHSAADAAVVLYSVIRGCVQAVAT